MRVSTSARECLVPRASLRPRGPAVAVLVDSVRLEEKRACSGLAPRRTSVFPTFYPGSKRRRWFHRPRRIVLSLSFSLSRRSAVCGPRSRTVARVKA